MAHPPVWTKDQPNILSPENVEKIKAACEGGFIFGLHGYFYGGSSASSWAYSNFTDFANDVSTARAGDYYLVWSTKELEKKNLILLNQKYEDSTPITLSVNEVETFRSYLQKKYNECFVIFINDKFVETKLNDADYTSDELLEDLESWCNEPGGEIYIVPFTDIDKAEHILIDAKKPNEKGEVPIGGAY